MGVLIPRALPFQVYVLGPLIFGTAGKNSQHPTEASSRFDFHPRNLIVTTIITNT